MIKSNLFNPLKKQPKSSRSTKEISLADVGRQLQITSISDVEERRPAPKGSSKCPPDSVGANQEIVAGENHRTHVDGFARLEAVVRNSDIAGDVRDHEFANVTSYRQVKGVASSLPSEVNEGGSEATFAANCQRVGLMDTRLVVDSDVGFLPFGDLTASDVITKQPETHRRLGSKRCIEGIAVVGLPSLFALTVCFNEQQYIKHSPRRAIRDGRAISRIRHRFRYKSQMADSSSSRRLVTGDRTVKPGAISVFDFSTPSPDDLIRNKQTMAFKT